LPYYNINILEEGFLQNFCTYRVFSLLTFPLTKNNANKAPIAANAAVKINPLLTPVT
jgi:hypothetical protein